MKIVNVIPLKKGPLKGDLTYFTSKDIENGSIVTITLRNKKILGLVVSIEKASDVKINIKDMNFNLKKIIEVKKKSVFLKEYLESAFLMSKYFASSKNDAVASLIPSVFREEYDKIAAFNKDGSWGNSLKNHPYLKAEKLLLQEPVENRIPVYKTLIRENFGLNKSVFVVLPNINDIKKFEADLSKGIEQFTFSIYGELSTKKIIEKFKQIISMAHPVLILGTAPFLSIPRPDIGVVILEHENSSGYKMIARPHFDLRVFAELFASKINAKFILGDNLLRFETIGRREMDGLIPMHPLSFRVNFDGVIEIENPRNNLEVLPLSRGKTSLFKILSQKSITEIQNVISRKKNPARPEGGVFIFTLRKGLATQTICKDCHEVLSCEKCSAPLVLYNLHKNKKGEKERIFVCNRCGEEKSGEIVCANCQSWNLIPLGIGTDTVFEELSKTFPKTKILKLDKEIVKNKKDAEKIIKEFEGNSGSILVGTEMALFYLKEKVSLSIIASFDSFWSIPNFKMSEKILQLVISITSISQDKFIIQTKNDQDPVILAIQSNNLLPFVREELEERKNLNYPPFKTFIKIKHLGNKVETLKAKQILAEIFKDYSPLIFSGFMARLKGKYATNALIKIDPQKWSLPELSIGSSIDENLLTKLLTLPPSFEVFVDPEDLL